MSCRGLFRCMLKVFNFLMALVGAGIVLYALFILTKWQSQRSGPPVIPSPLGPPIIPNDKPTPILDTPLSLPKQETDASQIHESNASEKQESDASAYHLLGRKLSSDMELKLRSENLPEAWFIYLFLAVGVVVCLITFSGHIAAETTNGCCLSFYTFFVTMLIIVEAGVAAFVLLDHEWDKDLPYDPTGQFDNIKNFIEANLDFCKWVGLAVAIVEGLALLSALIVRAIGSASRGNGYDSDDEYVPSRPGLRQPLINPQTSGATPAMPGGEARSSRGDAWTARMRDKYGLNTAELTYNAPETKRFSAIPTQGEQDNGRCAVM